MSVAEKTIDLKSLQNGLLTLFSDNIQCFSTWAVYLIDPKFDDEPELRNKIGVIWLSSLLDSIEGEARELDRYHLAAQALQQPILQNLCKSAAEFLTTVKELLGLYSREEQYFLRDLRDQWVHSWLARRHQTSFKLKYFDGVSYQVESFDRENYYALLRPLYEHPSGLDDLLSSLLQRSLKKSLRYWNAVEMLKRQMPELQRVIQGC